MPRFHIDTMTRDQRSDAAWRQAKPLLFVTGIVMLAFCSALAGATVQARDSHYSAMARV